MATKQTFKVSKQTKQIVLVGLIVLIILYFIKKFRDSAEQEEISNNTNADGTPKATTSNTMTKPTWLTKYNALPALGGDAPLKKGVKSREVWSMQYFYNERITKAEGKSKIDVDGIFGSQTQAALDYVTFKQRGSITLTGWDYITKLSKSERQTHFFPNNNNTELAYNPILFQAPTDNTYVFNQFNP